MNSEIQIDRESIEDLLHHDHYTPEELADLLGISLTAIQRSAREGKLHAYIVDHHILSLRRDDILQWLREDGSISVGGS